MGSISMPQGRGNRQHNLRNYGEGKLPSNVDASRTEQNIVWKDETTAHGEIKTPERDSLSVLEYKAQMREQEIQKLETQEKELRRTLRSLQSLIKQAEEKLEEAKKEAASIIESAKANEWLEKINIRLGLIPKKTLKISG